MSSEKLLSSPWFGPAIVAVAAWIGIVAAIDPAGSYPGLPEGPGLTVDEIFNVEQGFYLVEVLRNYGIGLLDPQSIRDVFDSPLYNPDHPPFGRLWLGVHHHLTRATFPLRDPFNVHSPVTACARTGSATAFALTILLIGWFAGVKYGPLAGFLSAAFLPLMPRVWGHAHLASLETITNLTCTAAVLSAGYGWSKATPPSVRSALVAGVLLGLAFLTKIQAVLVPIPLAAWCLWRWRWQAVKPLVIWGAVAAAVFFLGWPWLWLDPAGHGKEYFARTTARAVLSVWYFGTKYADVAVPWHYSWVMFATTLPVVVVVLGGVGCGVRCSVPGTQYPVPGTQNSDRNDSSLRWLLVGNALFPLILFSLPKVAVYDCERLFLTAFPFWAILAGIGAANLLQRIASVRIRTAVAAAVLGSLCVNLILYQPCFLSFYNIAVGRTAGAERLGLEMTYWGDSITRSLLNELTRQVPAGSTIQVAPVLHQFQLDDLVRQSPILRSHGVRLVPYAETNKDAGYVLLFRRRADLLDKLRDGPTNGKLLAEVRRGGAQLAALYELTSEHDR